MHHILGTIIHCPTDEKLNLEIKKEVLVSINDTNGRIESITDSCDALLEEKIFEVRQSGETLIELSDGQYLLPGLIDLHVHASQWPQVGKALDLPLEDWLHSYTFPLEAKYSDMNFAGGVYKSLVEALLHNGTTTAVYYGTIYTQSTYLLAQICKAKGQRCFVGKVSMNDPSQCPEYYIDSDDVNKAIAETRQFIQDIQELCASDDKNNDDCPLIRPIITPRFIPACTEELLRGLGQLAEEFSCIVQTHCSESDWEKDFVFQKYQATDCEALAKFGLLRKHTILAHCNFITTGDMRMIKDAQAAVAHCPLSNTYFANSVFPLRTALNANICVGLGSDLSGGYCPNIFDSCRHAIYSSCLYHYGVDPALPSDLRRKYPSKGIGESSNDGCELSPSSFVREQHEPSQNQQHTLSHIEAFYMATAGGGEALGIPVGRFVPGYKFDAMIIDVHAKDSNIQIFPELDTCEYDIFQKIILNISRVNIVQVFVDGKCVVNKS